MRDRFCPAFTHCRHCNTKYIFESSPYCSVVCHFWYYVRKSSKCWEWQGTKEVTGYGRFNIGKKFISAHRMSFLIHSGQLTSSLNVLHKCDNPSCVNPDHLYEGTYSQNNRDMVDRGRLPDQCKKGYEGKYSDGFISEVLSMKKQGFSFRKISRLKNLPYGSIYYLYKISKAKELGMGRKEINDKKISDLISKSTDKSQD